MKNKYFTPDIENLCIGYECEINNIHGKWESITITFTNSNSFYKTDLAEVCLLVEDKYVRVPYLTKEQIEAEGWKPEKSYFRKNNLYLFFENNELEIEFGEPFTWDASDSDVRYKGECKDINTFRLIQKLLGII